MWSNVVIDKRYELTKFDTYGYYSVTFVIFIDGEERVGKLDTAAAVLEPIARNRIEGNIEISPKSGYLC